MKQEINRNNFENYSSSNENESQYQRKEINKNEFLRRGSEPAPEQVFLQDKHKDAERKQSTFLPVYED